MNRSGEPDPEFFEKLWRATFRRARRPVEGVLLPDEAATKLAHDIFENLLNRYKTRPPDPEFSAESLEAAHDHSRRRVSGDRTGEENPQVHHDPEDTRYEKNKQANPTLQALHFLKQVDRMAQNYAESQKVQARKSDPRAERTAREAQELLAPQMSVLKNAVSNLQVS